ncbi:MAG TPA: LysR family transcriptional regulator substrate-binding protein [bacterium]|nr:LysR family transcriptional regulator substrate-binding protein [bacterium]HPN43949.1 LysR family transcriptional regulator substrate-binding protein [bacterium]
MITNLNLAAPTGTAESQLIRAVKILMEMHPELIVNIYDGTTNEIKDWLENGKKVENHTIEIDLTLQGKDIAEKNTILESIKMSYVEENLLIVPVNHPLASKEALKEDELQAVFEDVVFINRFKGAAVQEVGYEYLDEHKIKYKKSNFTVKSLEGSVRAVAAGIGVAILPRGTVEEILPDQIKGISLPGPGNKRQFYLAWKKGKNHSENAKELAKILGVDIP